MRMAFPVIELSKASPRTIRLTLLKIGTVVVSNTRWVRMLMSHSHTEPVLFHRVGAKPPDTPAKHWAWGGAPALCIGRPKTMAW